jgi:dihydrofolate reductase
VNPARAAPAATTARAQTPATTMRRRFTSENVSSICGPAVTVPYGFDDSRVKRESSFRTTIKEGTMAKVYGEISVSLDGYVAGPDQTLEDPLGRGGEQLHEWAFRLAAWRNAHGLEGGETGPESGLVERTLRATGAYVMGRRMFSGGEGPWVDDPNPNGWWGDEPPFHAPVFVVTHEPRERLDLQGTSFTFVTGGVADAVEQAREAAAGRDVQLHIAPVFLGDGVRLFDDVVPRTLEIVETIGTPQATHVHYRVNR